MNFGAEHRLPPPWVRFARFRPIAMLAASVASTALAGGSPSTIGRRALLAGAGSSAALLGTPAASHAAASVRGTSWYADEVDGVPASLDPSRWQIDARQFKEYDRSRAVLFDTRVGSYLPAAPARYIQAALHRDGDPRVIFAGETHTHPLHHLMQYELVRGVNDLDGKPLAIGLEMCYRQHQPALDAFVFGGAADGGGSFSELKKRVKWRKTWGYDINQYAKIFSYARQNGIRLVGLNVPYGMVQMVSNFGLRKLPDELRGCAGAILSARNSLGAQFSDALLPHVFAGTCPRWTSRTRSTTRDSSARCSPPPPIPPWPAAAAAAAARRSRLGRTRTRALSSLP